MEETTDPVLLSSSLHPEHFLCFLPMTDSIRSREIFLSMSIIAYYLQKGVESSLLKM